jgi:hypothetical protein
LTGEVSTPVSPALRIGEEDWIMRTPLAQAQDVTYEAWDARGVQLVALADRCRATTLDVV